MITKKHVMRLAISGGVLLALTGCPTLPEVVRVPGTEPGVTTIGLDVYDYQDAVAELTQEMMRRGLPAGYVVALGPVETKGTRYTVDIRMLQDRFEAAIIQNGKIKFSSAVDAVNGGTGTSEIYKLIEYNWWQKNPIDAEDLKKYGKISGISALLFGRISSMERRLPGGGTEITYTFAWRLTDTRTAEDVVMLMKDIRKNIR